MWQKKYITKQGLKNLHSYSYSGKDTSLIYQHILTPMNNFLINFFPLWMAPNLITLIGLGFNFFAHVIFLYYCPFLSGYLPPWALITNGICLFCYQTLDNLDGKQARRTGTSSPLGLLADHGIDALNCVLSGLTFSSTLQLGGTWKALALWMTASVAFYFATWEHFYTGSLILPVINGPTEGLLIGVMLNFLTAYAGVEFWTQPSYLGLERNTIMIYVMIVMCAFTILANTLNVSMYLRKNNKGELIVALTRLFPFLCLNAAAALWACASPSGIISTHPRIFLWTFGLLSAKMVTTMMTAHLCEESFHPFGKTLAPIFFVFGHVCLVVGYKKYMLGIDEPVGLEEDFLLLEFFVISFLTYAHLIYGIVGQITEELQINCFTIKKKEA